jgi:hypothetical protein
MLKLRGLCSKHEAHDVDVGRVVAVVARFDIARGNSCCCYKVLPPMLLMPLHLTLLLLL